MVRKLILLILILTVIISFVIPTPTLAHGGLSATLIPSNCTGSDASACTVTDMMHAFIHIAEWVLGIVGAVALATFVYGGFLFVTSAGSSTQVEHGKKILAGTTIGIVIVLGAFTVVGFVGDSLKVNSDFDEYLESSASRSPASSGVCRNDGDRCRGAGGNVYACVSGSCSSQTLCEYWASSTISPKPAGVAGVTSSYSCADVISKPCKPPGSIPIAGLCDGGSTNKCCEH